MTDAERIVALERRVGELEAQVDLLLELAGARVAPRRSSPDDHDPVLVEELRQGNLIRAIQRHRELTGVSLGEAKAACEALSAELGFRR